MVDPYRMIFVNLIDVMAVGVSLLFYYYVYPKKKINLFFLLLILSILPLVSVLRKGTYESGDLSIHVKFAMQFFENLSQGNYFPEWIGRHCSGYGCPVYIFLFTLPYYVISFFHMLGFTFLASAKLLLISTYILSGVGMFIWMKNELNEKAAFVAAIFYLFAPYHFIDLHFRVSIGELLSMAILPFAFYFTKRLIETKRPVFFILNGVSFASLILSHQVTSFVSLPLLFLYGLLVWSRDKKKDFLKLLIMTFSLISGILLASYYWIPLLLESKYTWYKIEDVIAFHPLSSFLYSQNRFGLLFQGHHGELYLNIGYVQWVIIGISLFLLLKRRLQGKEKKLMLAVFITFVSFFIMMQEITKPIWDFFSFLKNFQFSWRLMVEIILLTSVMAGLITTKIKNNTFIVILCSITILYTILNWGNRKTIPTNDATLKIQELFDEYPGGVDLTTPKWVDKYKQWIGTKPLSYIETLSGNSEFKTIIRTQTKHVYLVNIKKASLIKENTFYYPGWKVFANNKEIPIVYKNSQYPGVITFNLKEGFYKIDVIFSDTKDRKYSKLISLLSLISFILIIILSYLRKK